MSKSAHTLNKYVSGEQGRAVARCEGSRASRLAHAQFAELELSRPSCTLYPTELSCGTFSCDRSNLAPEPGCVHVHSELAGAPSCPRAEWTWSSAPTSNADSTCPRMVDERGMVLGSWVGSRYVALRGLGWFVLLGPSVRQAAGTGKQTSPAAKT